MTYHNHALRPAMTAIAAVIALSSTPLFAQSAGTPAPIIESTPVQAAPDPLAPAPTVTDTTTAEPAASETTVARAATPRSAAKASKPAARARATTTRSTTVTRTVAATPMVAAATAPAAQMPVEPVAALPMEAAPAPAPVAEPAPVATSTLSTNEALPIAGAAGLGLLALLGTGFAMRRRRRRQDDAIHEAKWQQIEAAPDSAFEPAPAPSFVPTPVSDPAPVAAVAATDAAASNLPDGFDVSRFGPHVQAAYAGPTPDNPSLSLKRRLTVGHFLDKQEAEASHLAAPATVASKPAEVPAAKPARAARVENDFMFRRAETKPGLRPVYQK